MRKYFDRIAFCRVLFVFCALAATGAADAADLLRYVQRDKTTKEYREDSRSCQIAAFTKDGVEVNYIGANKEQKTIVLPGEQVLWLQFESEPLALSAARVEMQVGNYEEALAKIDEIESGEVKTDLVALEIEWNRSYAVMQRAFSGVEELGKAVAMMRLFIENAPDHYRYYEANALLGDAEMAQDRFDAAAKYYAVLDAAKSDSYKARGKVGLAQVAFAKGEYDKANQLFSDAANAEALDAQLEGLNVRVVARIGLAKTLAAQGKSADALKTLDQVLADAPNSATRQQATIYNAFGEIYADAGLPQEAIVAYLHVDLLYPAARTERVKALKALVELWEQVGRQDRADETIKRLSERFGVNLRSAVETEEDADEE